MKTLKMRNGLQLLLVAGIFCLTVFSCKCDKSVNRANKDSNADAAAAAAAGGATELNAEDSGDEASQGSVDESGNFVYNVGDETEITLEDGTVLKVGSNSTEAKLYNRLSGDYTVPAEAGKEDWIVMDRVYFGSGGSALAPESEKQVDNVAKILKNFPNSQLKMGGYTDNTGTVEANINVSAKRANAVLQEVVKRGISAERLKAEGFGPEHPVCPANDTDACKAQNRRVDIRIAAK